MDNILELIRNEEVKWVKLGEVCTILDSKRKPISKTKRIEGIYPYYGANGIQDYVNGYIFDGTYILMGEDGSVIKKDNTPVLHWVKNSKIWVNNHAHILEEKEEKYNLRYIYYYLSTVDVSSIVRGTPPKITQANMKDIEIPIPSLELQEKIVKILDKYTDAYTKLQVALKNEIELRTKQYNYYKDMLLSQEYLLKKAKELCGQDAIVLTKTLGEIGKIKMCKRILKDQTSPIGDIPFYKIGTFGKKADSFISRNLFLEYKEKYNYPKTGEILISASGTIGRTVIFNGEDSYFQDSNIVWISHDEKEVLNKYLYHFYKIVKWNISEGGTIQRLYSYNLEKTKILIPPLEVQEWIVNILYPFYTITYDLKKGLTREIELRKKQYEYYLEKLLNFEKNAEQNY